MNLWVLFLLSTLAQAEQPIYGGLGDWFRTRVSWAMSGQKNCSNVLGNNSYNLQEAQIFLDQICPCVGNKPSAQELLNLNAQGAAELGYAFVHTQHGKDLACESKLLDLVDVTRSREKAQRNKQIILQDTYKKISAIREIDEMFSKDLKFIKYQKYVKDPSFMNQMFRGLTGVLKNMEQAYGKDGLLLFGGLGLSARGFLAANERVEANQRAEFEAVPQEVKEFILDREKIRQSIWQYQDKSMREKVEQLIRAPQMPPLSRFVDPRGSFLDQVINEKRANLEDQMNFWQQGARNRPAKRKYLETMADSGALWSYMDGQSLEDPQAQKAVRDIISGSGAYCYLDTQVGSMRQARQSAATTAELLAVIGTMGASSLLTGAKLTSAGARVLAVSMSVGMDTKALSDFKKTSDKCAKTPLPPLNLNTCRALGESNLAMNSEKMLQAELDQTNCVLDMSVAGLAAVGSSLSLVRSFRTVAEAPIKIEVTPIKPPPGKNQIPEWDIPGGEKPLFVGVDDSGHVYLQAGKARLDGDPLQATKIKKVNFARGTMLVIDDVPKERVAQFEKDLLKGKITRGAMSCSDAVCTNLWDGLGIQAGSAKGRKVFSDRALKDMLTNGFFDASGKPLPFKVYQVTNAATGDISTALAKASKQTKKMTFLILVDGPGLGLLGYKAITLVLDED